MDAITVHPARRVRGRLRLPGDKSISHRYAILAALAPGRSRITGLAGNADCAATLACLEALGVEVGRGAVDGGARGTVVTIAGRDLRGLRRPDGPLDAANSGTTLRLLAGVLAAHPFETTLTGDASLRRRPVRRVAEPLERMGARILSSGDRPPITVIGSVLHGLSYATPVPSAQVKSAVLLAGLQAVGRTEVREPAETRDHTERAMAAFGARVERNHRTVTIEGGQRLEAVDLRVPGDISAAAFWAVAAAGLEGSDVEMDGVGLNPTRARLLDVLRQAGVRIDVSVENEEAGEPRGRIRVRHGGLAPLIVRPEDVPGLIDELPVLAALATHGSAIAVTGAAELRVKESDRIAALVTGLRALGAEAEEWPDGFQVRGARRLRGGEADAAGDHRLAMAFAIAALGAAGPSVIRGADAVAVSYPGFFETLRSLCA